MDITDAKATDLINAQGAAHLLNCSHDQVRQWAKTGRVRSFGFNAQGELVERSKDERSRGSDLLFLRDDLKQFSTTVVRRRRKSTQAAL